MHLGKLTPIAARTVGWDDLANRTSVCRGGELDRESREKRERGAAVDSRTGQRQRGCQISDERRRR